METLENKATMSETERLDNIIVASRRKMMTLAGTAFAGLALGKVASAQTTTAPVVLTDNDYLNFALNLEYLEAQFYTLATAGMTIDKLATPVSILGGQTTAGTVTTKGSNNYASCQVPFTNPVIQAYATETALEERNHVIFLSSALGSSAVAMPNIDLYNSFNALGMATIGSAFDPFGANGAFSPDVSFLLGAFIFEDVGVTAYSGAAPALTSAGNLAAASGILAVEAYHAGLVRTTLFGLDAQSPTLGINATATKIANFRAVLDGSSSSKTGADDLGLGLTTSGSLGLSAATIVDADANSLAYTRTAAQVLNIVYASTASPAVPGGFFPAGLNGNVK